MNVNTLIDLFVDEDEEEYTQLLQQQFLTNITESMSAPVTHGGSRSGRSPNIDRESQAGHSIPKSVVLLFVADDGVLRNSKPGSAELFVLNASPVLTLFADTR